MSYNRLVLTLVGGVLFVVFLLVMGLDNKVYLLDERMCLDEQTKGEGETSTVMICWVCGVMR